MIKILFVINTLGRAGAERALVELLKRLSPKEYEIFLYVLLGQGDMRAELPSHVKLLNTDYKATDVLSKAGARELHRTVLKSLFSRGRFLRNMGIVRKNLMGMIKRRRILPDKLFWRVLSESAPQFDTEYDLAVAYLEGGATYYVADCVKAKKKAAFVHIDYAGAGYTRELDNGCYEKFDRIFGVSDEVREHFLSIYPEFADKTKVFHNLIDYEGILKRGEEQGGFSDDFDGIRLLTVGRLTYQKAYDIAIDAMRLLKDEGYNVRWYVLGEGDLRANLESRVKGKRLTEDFVFLGAVTNPFPYYKQCDIYVHATRFEGKSIAVQEAQTFGKPILASDCNGNREQITDGVDGILCELSAAAVKDKLVRLIKEPELRARLGRAAAGRRAENTGDMELLLGLLKE